MSNPDGKIQTLQIGRGLAALAVVGHHAAISADAFSSKSFDLMEWGAQGVDFFFVLSGFIIFWVHAADQRTASTLLRYGFNRISRVYLPYLPVGIGIMLLYVALPSVSASSREWGVLTSVTLIPSLDPPALSVAWTLRYEMVFYMIFALMYWGGVLGVASLFWACAIVTFEFLVPSWKPTTSALLEHLLSTYSLEFICGMAAAALVRRGFDSVLLPLGIGLAMVSAYQILDVSRVFLAVGLATLLVASVSLESRSVTQYPKFFVFLGSASYSIYLVHNPLQSVLVRVVQSVGAENWLLLFLGCVLFGLIGGCAYYAVVERTGLRIARRLRTRVFD